MELQVTGTKIYLSRAMTPGELRLVEYGFNNPGNHRDSSLVVMDAEHAYLYIVEGDHFDEQEVEATLKYIAAMLHAMGITARGFVPVTDLCEHGAFALNGREVKYFKAELTYPGMEFFLKI